MLVKKRLEESYREAEVLPFDSNSKFVLMSDCHRGQGNAADNFLQNQNVYFGALEYYYDSGFTYIEIGDGDELWENRSMKAIVNVHDDAFWMLSKFYRGKRLQMIYGNHDVIKKRKNFMSVTCNEYYCDEEGCCKPLFPGIKVFPAIILQQKNSRNRLFLVHGHQGSILNDYCWPCARFLVRYVWKRMELIGFNDPTGAGRPRKNREKIEKELTSFANQRKEILIAGHTHRPVFPKPGESYYFNDGSCVHPRCITAIEIENGSISLVKWSVCTGKNRNLYVGREILEGPEKLDNYFIK